MAGREDEGRGGWGAEKDSGTSCPSAAMRAKSPLHLLRVRAVVFFFPALNAYSLYSGHILIPCGQSVQEWHVPFLAFVDFFGGLLLKMLQNRGNITLMERAKWALFLKSFFEISEAIPWPRDHILFTFSLPTTQATLAKFTKEDPHWKIRLIPD